MLAIWEALVGQYSQRAVLGSTKILISILTAVGMLKATQTSKVVPSFTLYACVTNPMVTPDV